MDKKELLPKIKKLHNEIQDEIQNEVLIRQIKKCKVSNLDKQSDKQLGKTI